MPDSGGVAAQCIFIFCSHCGDPYSYLTAVLGFSTTPVFVLIPSLFSFYYPSAARARSSGRQVSRRTLVLVVDGRTGGNGAQARATRTMKVQTQRERESAHSCRRQLQFERARLFFAFGAEGPNHSNSNRATTRRRAPSMKQQQHQHTGGHL